MGVANEIRDGMESNRMGVRWDGTIFGRGNGSHFERDVMRWNDIDIGMTLKWEVG